MLQKEKKNRREIKSVELTQLGPKKELGWAFYELGEQDRKQSSTKDPTCSPKKVPSCKVFDKDKLLTEGDESSANSIEHTPMIHKIKPPEVINVKTTAKALFD